MSVEKMLKNFVISGLFILISSNALADVSFDVSYGASFQKQCSAKSLKIDPATQTIIVDGLPSENYCLEDSKADFSKKIVTNVKTLTVDVAGNTTKFNVLSMYGDIVADNVINPINGTILLVLGPYQVTPDPGTIDTKNLKIIEPQINGFTHLPGCIGLITTDPSLCRTTGSIGSEVYAVRLDTSSLKDMYQNQVFSVRGITHDDMNTVDNIFRSFVMAISTTPGDFAPAGQACSQTDGSGVLDINVMQVQTNVNAISDLKDAAQAAVKLALSNPANIALLNEANNKILQVKAAQNNLQSLQDGSVCVLEKGKTYYVNVRPVNPGCKAYVNGVLTSPNGPCRIEVSSQLPVPAK